MKTPLRIVLCLLLLWTHAAVLLAQDNSPHIYAEKEGGDYVFYVDNKLPAEVWISLSFPHLTNFRPSEESPYATLLAPKEKKKQLLVLSQIDPRRSAQYQISSKFTVGNPETARHDEEHSYYFPFEHGGKFKLSQGYMGSFSHSGENLYAVDFTMNTGTEIYAARGGFVAAVKEDSRVGGPTLQYGGHENYITILHEDGSMGQYVHLRYGGAIVEPGEAVNAGQLIGYSGNTGLSTGPHLHFSVNMPQQNGTMQSIPIFFLDHEGSRVSPEEGRHYYAFHPGKPAFSVIFGADLSEEDFASHQVAVEKTGRVEVVTEQVDDTSIVYVRNGTLLSQKLTLSARLQHMSSTRSLPTAITVPALSEIFVTLLRVVPGARASSYRLQIAPYAPR